MKHDPTLYEPWTPASTCYISSIIGPAIGAIGSLIGGSQAAGAAEDASDAQVRAAQIAAGVGREALGFQREMYNVGRADLAPYRASGAGALQTLNQMFIPGGHSMVQMQGQLNELRAQRARLMSGGQAGSQYGQGALGSAGSYPGVINQLREEGGGAGGDAAVQFREDFYNETGHEFGMGGERGVPGGEAGITSSGPGAGHPGTVADVGREGRDDRDDDYSDMSGVGRGGDWGAGMV